MLAALALLASGCGSHGPAGDRVSGHRLTIYVSVPLNGASRISARAVLNGAELALAAVRARIGRLRVVLRELDDSTVQSRGWDPGQTTLNVRRATLDRTTIGYIGEFNSGASAVSIPILNRAGIPQISPSSTAVGLTQDGPAASPGEPLKYYPTGVRTFARVVPSDAIQAVVQVRLARSLGCTRLYLLDDGEVDGRDEASSFQVAAGRAHLNIVGAQEFQPGGTDYTGLAAGVAQARPDCVLVSSITESNAALVVRQVAAALPRARFIGSAGLAESSFTSPALGGIPLSLDSRIAITVATLDPSDYGPAGRRFLSAYVRRFGRPQPYAIYGYEAMSLMLDAIARSTDGGAQPAVRSKVRAAIFATRDRHSVLGTYGIDPSGDTTLTRYGVYRVRDGRLSFWTALPG